MRKKALSSIIALILLLSALPAALAADAYAYSLDALHFTDLSGNVLENPTGSCMASVRMTKTDAGRTATDSLILSAYSTTGELIAFNVMQSYMDPNEYRTFSSLINVPKDETLGEVRAFVWDNLADMTALSEMVSLTVNGSVEPVPDPDTYTVSGYVSETYKTNAYRAKDKSLFVIQSANNFEGQKIDPANPLEITCDLGGSDLASYPTLPVIAELKRGENGIYKLVSYEKTATVTTLETDLLDWESCTFDTPAPSISVFPTPTAFVSTKYPLSADVLFYINGTEITAPDLSDFEEYLLNSSSPTFELADFDYDGRYDAIYGKYYAIGRVDAVSASTGKIMFSHLNVRGNSITPDEKSTRVYKNGSEIALADIQAGDILTIAYDVTMDLQPSHYYDIYVSSDTAEGQYTSYNPADETVTIGGTAYEFAAGDSYSNIASMTLGNEYILYLDVFGRIFSYDTLKTLTSFAILEHYTKSSTDDYYKAMLYLTDGTIVRYELNNNKVTIDGKTGAALDEYLENRVYIDTNENGYIDGFEKTNTNRQPIQDRVVAYRVSSSGLIVSLSFESGRMGNALFSANTNAVGAVKMNERTKIINAIAYNAQNMSPSLLEPANLSDFVDGANYEIYGYGERLTDGSYPFVLIVSMDPNSENPYPIEPDNTHFAVISSDMPRQAYDPATGNFIYAMDVIYNGETVLLETVDEAEFEIFDIDDSTLDAFDLRKGDVILFRGSPDSVEQINIIFRGSEYVGDYERNTITSLLQAGDNSDKIGIPADVEITSSGFSKWTTDWAPISTEQNVQLVAGPIVEKGTGYFTIGKIAESTYDDYYSDYYTGLYTDIYGDSSAEDGVLEINISDQTKVAVYNYFYAEQARPAVGATGDIIASTIPQSYYLGDDQNIIPWDTLVDEDFPINFAFAKITNGEATDVFVINAP